MNFFNKAKEKIKAAYKSGADFSHEINQIKLKSQAEKLKILKQETAIARERAKIAEQKKIINGNKGSQTARNGLFNDNFDPMAGLNKVLLNGSKTKEKRQENEI